MAVDKLVNSTQLDADLTSVANAIRTKGGTSADLAFPAGFVSAINAISGGGGGIAVPDWATYEEVTIEANSITNTSAGKTYFSSYAPYVLVLLVSNLTVNNQIFAYYLSTGGGCMRYKNGAIATTTVGTNYDGKLVEGTKYYVFSQKT